MISEEQLVAWERLANEATDGPWEYGDGEGDCWHTVYGIYAGEDDCTAICQLPFSTSQGKNDAAFICAAREAIPKLIAEVRRLQPYAPVGREFDWVNGDD